MTEPQGKIVPFGKYKGQPVEALVHDRQYVEWLTAQPWFKEKFQPIYNLVINNFGEPSETPEHNAMQALFLDDEYVVAVGMATGADLRAYATCEHRVQEIGQRLASLAEAASNQIANNERYIEIYGARKIYAASGHFVDYAKEIESCRLSIQHSAATRDALGALRTAITQWLPSPRFRVGRVKATFEQEGVDVTAAFAVWPAIAITDEHRILLEDTYPATGNHLAWHDTIAGVDIRLELKPTLGDEYPGVLRQMDRNGTSILIVGEFRAEGATLEQCTKLFARSRKTLVMMSEVRSHLVKAKEALENRT